MRHTWRAAGSRGVWVWHSSRDDGHASDSIGVGVGEDVLGPFSSHKLAVKVADALTSAYIAGQEDPDGRYDPSDGDGDEDEDTRFRLDQAEAAGIDRDAAREALKDEETDE